MAADCLFCKIVAGEIPADKVLSTDRITVFRDISPQAPTHLLVIPNTHTPSVRETADSALLADVFAGARDAADTLGLEDYRLVVNNGAEAGQTVFHLHMHVLAGRPLDWPPG